MNITVPSIVRLLVWLVALGALVMLADRVLGFTRQAVASAA